MATAENISRVGKVFFAEMRQNRCQFAAHPQACTSNLLAMETTTPTRHRPSALLTGLQPDPERLGGDDRSDFANVAPARRAARDHVMGRLCADAAVPAAGSGWPSAGGPPVVQGRRQPFRARQLQGAGGAYAVREQIGSKRGRLVVACATEGNHGRSVAWAARRSGAQCVIYLHARVSEAREQAIANYGASIRRIAGTYDDAVRQCAVDAEREGLTVISDTSWAGYEEIPRSVMAGYTVLTREIVEQMAGEAPPTHVFLQGGVGGMAAAALADLSESAIRWRQHASILVEPLDAACLMASLRANRPIRIEGEMKTVMAGLACGEPSPIALEIVSAGVSAAIAIGDDLVVEAMHMMAAGAQGDPRIVAGPSGAAGLGGPAGASG